MKAFLIAVIISLFLVAGCSLHNPSNVFLNYNFNNYKIERVAVLPFYNKSGSPDAGEIVTQAFIRELFSREKFEVEFSGNIRKFLIRERIIIRKGIGADNIRLIGKRLNVDAVFIGCVQKYDMVKEGQYGPVLIVSIDSRMIHTDSCSILWMGQNYRKGDEYETILGYGRVRNLAELSRKVIKELIGTIP